MHILTDVSTANGQRALRDSSATALGSVVVGIALGAGLVRRWTSIRLPDSADLFAIVDRVRQTGCAACE
jgi:hypothetical protein